MSVTSSATELLLESNFALIMSSPKSVPSILPGTPAMLAHHIVVPLCFGAAIWSGAYTPLLAVMLLCEVNSVGLRPALDARVGRRSAYGQRPSPNAIRGGLGAQQIPSQLLISKVSLPSSHHGLPEPE